MLRQSLINLVDNAIKDTPTGGRIRIHVADTASGPSLVTVSDSGPGMAPECTDQNSDRYERGGRRPEPTDIGGSGLWSRDREMGRRGQWRTTPSSENTQETGSTFRITLPRALTTAGAKA